MRCLYIRWDCGQKEGKRRIWLRGGVVLRREKMRRMADNEKARHYGRAADYSA